VLRPRPPQLYEALSGAQVSCPDRRRASP
jgi:hypothetical protein